ncbi:hypothetical protein [uncultured Moraxella sp.]|uniref:hypothetical protein n=1 Tax=uncultured Moraxella sp. TaxID=263769 RepID=UPI0025DA9E90|nr:hypothetical protein [uncultured Moraxella sp.]
MFGITDLTAYVLTVLVLIALPGPNSMFCFGTALAHGFTKAKFAIMGTFLGNGTLIVASAFVASDTANPMMSLLVLVLIFQSCSLMFLLILTKCSGLIGQKLGQFVWLNRVRQTGAGLIFLGFAVKLAMT